MRKQKLNMQDLINSNRNEILSNKEEIDRIEKKLEEKYNKVLRKSS